MMCFCASSQKRGNEYNEYTYYTNAGVFICASSQKRGVRFGRFDLAAHLSTAAVGGAAATTGVAARLLAVAARLLAASVGRQ